MTTQKDLHIIVGWLADIANATTTPPGEDMKAKLIARAKSLAVDFPDIRAFTWDSAKFVSTRHDFFPSTMLLTKTLGEWWDTNRPIEPAMAISHDLARFSPQARHMIQTWQRHRLGVPLPGEPPDAVWVSMCRAHVNAAYLFLLRSDEVVQAIAREKDWYDWPAPPLSDEEREAIIAARHQVAEAVTVVPERMARQPAHPLAVADPAPADVVVDAPSAPPPEVSIPPRRRGRLPWDEDEEVA